MESLDDRDLQEIYEELKGFSIVVARGAFLVEEFPIPSRDHSEETSTRETIWREIKCSGTNLWLRLWRELAAKIVKGTAPFCYVRGFMGQKWQEMGVSELQGAYVAGSMIEVSLIRRGILIISGGFRYPLNSLILGLIAFPRASKKPMKSLIE